jgi:hypothetical protein
MEFFKRKGEKEEIRQTVKPEQEPESGLETGQEQLSQKEQVKKVFLAIENKNFEAICENGQEEIEKLTDFLKQEGKDGNLSKYQIMAKWYLLESPQGPAANHLIITPEEFTEASDAIVELTEGNVSPDWLGSVVKDIVTKDIYDSLAETPNPEGFAAARDPWVNARVVKSSEINDPDILAEAIQKSIQNLDTQKGKEVVLKEYESLRDRWAQVSSLTTQDIEHIVGVQDFLEKVT